MYAFFIGLEQLSEICALIIMEGVLTYVYYIRLIMDILAPVQ